MKKKIAKGHQSGVQAPGAGKGRATGTAKMPALLASARLYGKIKARRARAGTGNARRGLAGAATSRHVDQAPERGITPNRACEYATKDCTKKKKMYCKKICVQCT